MLPLILLALFAFANAYEPLCYGPQCNLLHSEYGRFLNVIQPRGYRSLFREYHRPCIGTQCFDHQCIGTECYAAGLHGYRGKDLFRSLISTDYEIEAIKAKLENGLPWDLIDFEIFLQKLHSLPKWHLDELEQIITRKLANQIPVRDIEAEILNECFKEKIVRGQNIGHYLNVPSRFLVMNRIY